MLLKSVPAVVVNEKTYLRGNRLQSYEEDKRQISDILERIIQARDQFVVRLQLLYEDLFCCSASN